MTPAKLIARQRLRRDTFSILEAPIAQVSSLIYNVNRGVGDESQGIPPSPQLSIDEFRLYKRAKGATLAAKDRDYLLDGAVCDQAGWVAYTKSKRN